jgi:serine/threonine protein kinase
VHDYPDEVIFNSNIFVPSTTRKDVATTRGFVKFYSFEELDIIVKFVKQEFEIFAISEVKGNLLLVDYPADCILPILYASKYKNYFVFVSRAMSDDLHGISKLEKVPIFENVTNLLQCMIKALLYLHSLHLVHSDIKTENIVQDKISGNYMLIDFDTLELENEDGIVHTCQGTTGMFSLQRLQHHTSSISDDIWSLSVVIYEYITKNATLWNKLEDFKPRTQTRAVKNMKHATKNWSRDQRKKIIPLFLKMNEYNNYKRITIDELNVEIKKFV